MCITFVIHMRMAVIVRACGLSLQYYILRQVSFYSIFALFYSVTVKFHDGQKALSTGMQDGIWKFSKNAYQPTILILLL